MKHILSLALIVCGAFSPVFAQNVDGRPNIIVILSDDCGYNEFSMHGSKIPTPCIDSIAARGVRFTNGYVSGCVCSPTRAGLLTGRYQQRFGHEYNIPASMSPKNGLSLDETTIADVLKAGGYRTIALGKWHLGYDPKFNPCERGFTDYYGFLQGMRSYWPLEKPSKLNELLLNREPVSPEKFDYLTDHLAEKAVEYIKDTKSKPFFIYLAFNATHTPMHVPEADLEKANGNKIAAMTMALDRGVGKVLDALKEEKIEDKTMVIFLNDNGGAAGHDNAPLNGRKGSCWEGGIRVPYTMQWPGVIPAGTIDDRPVISLDIFPTAMAAAGIEQSSGKQLDGVNLLPYVTGKNTSRPHDRLYWKSGDSWAVREGDLKLVVPQHSDPTPPKLFDLAKDISESNDLASERTDDVKRLEKLYESWKATHKPTPWGRNVAVEAEP